MIMLMAMTYLAETAIAPSTWAGIATAIATVITALGGFIVAIAVLIPNLHISRETHKLVNQSHTDLINYQRALIRALKDKGIDIPIDQSAQPLLEDNDHAV